MKLSQLNINNSPTEIQIIQCSSGEKRWKHFNRVHCRVDWENAKQENGCRKMHCQQVGRICQGISSERVC